MVVISLFANDIANKSYLEFIAMPVTDADLY